MSGRMFLDSLQKRSAMGWWKEFAKSFLNLAVVTIAVLVYGSLTNPQWNVRYAIWGILLTLWWWALSYFLWRIGGTKDV